MFKSVRLWIAVLLSLVLIAGCSGGAENGGNSAGQSSSGTSSSSEGADSPAPVKIGVLVPKTGKGKDWGLKTEIAYKIAANEINNNGGINGSPLELIIEDTGGKNEEAVTLTREMIRKGVAAIAGPYFSGEAEVAYPIANKEGVPIISSSAAKPGITDNNRPWAFRNAMSNDKLMEVTVPAFAKHYNVSKFAIIYDEKDAVSKSDGTDVLPKAIENNGYVIVNKNEPITFKTGDTDFSAIVTKLKGMNPEAIAFGGLYQEGLNFAKELKRQGLNVPVIGTVGLFSMALLEEGGADVEGWVVPSFFNTFSDDARVVQFIVQFEPEAVKYTPNSTLPDAFNASAYDTMHIIAKSLIDKGLNGDASLDEQRQAIREGWEGLKDYKGITGNTTILENGDAQKQVYVLIIDNGEYKEIQQ